jgi:hypothetical protein
MSLRDIERESIRLFLESHARQYVFTGKNVLDYGCGSSPYRAIIEAGGGIYTGHDSPEYGGHVVGETTVGIEHVATHEYDVVVATQILQYVSEPEEELSFLRTRLPDDGVLLMTGPTNWPVIERDDLWRFTPAGIEALLYRARFSRVSVEERAHVNFEGERWPIGWQATARP